MLAEARERAVALRRDGNTAEAKALEKKCNLLEAAKGCARKTMMKVSWAEFVTNVSTLDDEHIDLPLASQCLATRRYALDQLNAGNKEKWATSAMDVWPVAAPGESDCECEDGAEFEKWSVLNPTSGSCQPAADAPEDEWEVWRNELMMSFFNDKFFETTEDI